MDSRTDAAPRNPSSRKPSSEATPRKGDSRRDRRWPKEIRCNERFVKVAELLEAAQTVWVVWNTVDQPGLPRHVKLIQESDPKRSLTVAVSALADRRLYRRLDPAPTSVGADQRVVVDGAGTRPPVAGGNLVPFLRGVRDPDEEPDEGGRASG